MNRSMLLFSIILVLGVFISSISQVLLKKAALKHYESKIKEYLNPLVIIAYTFFVASTFASIYAYKGIPLSMGPILESLGYFFVTFFGVKIFGEKLNLKKIIALVFILSGIAVYSFLG